MNSQPVSLDFTANVAKNSSANPAVDASKAEDNQFKKELDRQASNSRQAEKAETKPQEKPEEKSTEAVLDTEKRVSVAADEAQNGEELPESDGLSQSELLNDENTVETLLLAPGSDIAVPIESDFSIAITDLNIPGLEEGEAVSLLGGQSEEGLIVVPGAVSGGAQPTAAGLVPVNSRMTPENSLNTLNSVLDSGSQPVEKLMTLNQIKASLENSLETMAELEIDLDTESSVKEVMRFNDIQLKENQSALKSYTTSVPLPMSQAAWGEQVSDKVIWLANQKIQFAEIHLNPQELGPVDVKINMQNDQAAITFTSPHQAVRDLLELNVNRLREMMNENGVDLAHVDVSDQSSQHESKEDGDTDGAGMAGAEGESLDIEGAEMNSLAIEQENLVDYYA